LANKIKVKIVKKNVRNLLKSKEMKECLEQTASQVISRAGNGYGKDTYLGRNRYNVAVYPITKEARNDTYKNNTLLKSLK
jgi:hypothetical protein